ncbi:hypothetical protein CDAR_432491 [Caerostris darwini]|uniref:Uncharacterized protein n=1 Tax=Caerostris darwini TaxID=1538125 RepID=A0AAV4U334_9ARAC|nr:hypothetical protein CDAR_432491 [Caerostris darwini]
MSALSKGCTRITTRYLYIHEEKEDGEERRLLASWIASRERLGEGEQRLQDSRSVTSAENSPNHQRGIVKLRLLPSFCPFGIDQNRNVSSNTFRT